MKSFVSITVIGLSVFSEVHAWGNMGHETVAYIAQNFISARTKTYCQGILDDTTTSFLANAATWADTYRYTSAGSFSYPYHFIDAEDNPPTSCNVDYTRDCGAGGCSVSAINNYTNILLGGEDLDALKFIIHFIGDLHQPLHDEDYEVGGNDIDVTFGSISTNLHHIWDTEILNKIVGGSTIEDAETWATTLTAAIKTGTYKNDAADWIADVDITDPVTTFITFAAEANAYVCDEVLGKGVTYVEDTDLSGAYYTAAEPVVKLQIARAGYRLAAWLNLIATGEIGL